MIWNTDDDDPLPGGKWLNLTLLVLTLGGLAINLLLLFRHLITSAIAGCGGGSPCEELLASRWSQVFGMPVTAFGVLVYLALTVSLLMKTRPLLTMILGVIVGAAAWFVFVQAVLLGRFCPWCMTAHGIGLCVAALGLWRQWMADHTEAIWMPAALSATGVVLAIYLLQHHGPGPANYRIDDSSGFSRLRTSGIYALKEGRKVAFAEGKRIYNVSVLPHLGHADAKCVMVEYLDYSCPSCRKMGGFLDSLMARHPADLCLVILPVPLDRSCNFSLGENDTEFPGSCKLTKLALALWRTKPQEFAGFHRALLNGASTDDAATKARTVLTQLELTDALRDPWIDELIQANIADYAAFSQQSNKLPKLLITGRRILHGLPSGEADFIRVMESELGL